MDKRNSGSWVSGAIVTPSGVPRRDKQDKDAFSILMTVWLPDEQILRL